MPVHKVTLAGQTFKSKTQLERHLTVFLKERWGKNVSGEDADYLTTIFKTLKNLKGNLDEVRTYFIVSHGTTSSTVIAKTEHSTFEIPWRKVIR